LPTIEFNPSKITVPPGSVQPIATRYGLTYEIPLDWTNMSGSVAGWDIDTPHGGWYQTVGQYGGGHCPEVPAESLALSGAAGRNGVDLDGAARDEVRAAMQIFASEDGLSKPSVTYVGPQLLTVADQQAVRYTAIVRDIPQDRPCKTLEARFEILATAGRATAEVMVLMVEIDEHVSGSVDPSVADQIFNSIRPSEGF
jgi:hypothetical protein